MFYTSTGFTSFFFPVPFNFLLYDICKSRYHKGALIFSILYLTNMAVDVLLQCTGIIDMSRLLSVIHVIMVANVVYTVVIILYEAGKKENDVAQNSGILCAWSWDLEWRK